MQWTKQKLAELPIENGFYLRGHGMTRIEIFVAAAFAFCITLIMISGDSIPTTIAETKQATLAIPAFVFSAAQLIWIWYAHASWSKRYGLEDAITIVLSGLLTMLVLVYVYPLRMMASGMFSWLSDGYFSSGYQLSSFNELRFLFYFSAIGFALLGLVFWLFFRHALAKTNQLQLTPFEVHSSQSDALTWLVVLFTALTVFVLTLILPDALLPFAPMFYSSLGISLPMLAKIRAKSTPEHSF